MTLYEQGWCPIWHRINRHNVYADGGLLGPAKILGSGLRDKVASHSHWSHWHGRPWDFVFGPDPPE